MKRRSLALAGRTGPIHTGHVEAPSRGRPNPLMATRPRFLFAGAVTRSRRHRITMIETVSRRMEDLARDLNCLGFFSDDDDDRPRAA